MQHALLQAQCTLAFAQHITPTGILLLLLQCKSSIYDVLQGKGKGPYATHI
jgi:hypothetical protein